MKSPRTPTAKMNRERERERERERPYILCMYACIKQCMNKCIEQCSLFIPETGYAHKLRLWILEPALVGRSLKSWGRKWPFLPMSIEFWICMRPRTMVAEWIERGNSVVSIAKKLHLSMSLSCKTNFNFIELKQYNMALEDKWAGTKETPNISGQMVFLTGRLWEGPKEMNFYCTLPLSVSGRKSFNFRDWENPKTK